MAEDDDDPILPTARLAHLSVDPDEARVLAADFAVILGSFRAALASVASADRRATSPAEHGSPLRADRVVPSDRAAAILAAAPDASDDHFRVPPAIGAASGDDA